MHELLIGILLRNGDHDHDDDLHARKETYVEIPMTRTQANKQTKTIFYKLIQL